MDLIDSRLEIYNSFKDVENPVLAVSGILDIDKDVKITNTELMACVLEAVNQVPNLKLRIENDTIVYHEDVGLGFTVKSKNESSSYKLAISKYDTDFETSCKNISRSVRQALKRKSFYCEDGERMDLVYLSYMPFVSFTGVQQPYSSLTCSIPAIILGQLKDGKLPISVAVHHGLADGYHIGVLAGRLTKIIEGCYYESLLYNS